MMTFKFLPILLLVFNQGKSFVHEWELKQFSNFESDSYYSSAVFNTTEEAVKDARNATIKFMTELNIPGLVIGFSIKGKTIWNEGFGQIDIENNVTTDRNSVWRLASISKPLTSALVGQLIERGLLDLNASIHKYIPESLFPRKTFNGEPVDITVRQLLSHTAGLYLSRIFEDFSHLRRADNVSQTISLKKKEDLLFKPGTKYSYSNYGYQMVGALIEAVLKNSYQNEIKKMFLSLGMNSTFAETRDKIFSHRPRYYMQREANSTKNLQNADIIDDLFSYEGWWPSGGLVSTVGDLLTFGNAMLSASKGKKKEFLSQSMVKELWRPETIEKPMFPNLHPSSEYAKGWVITHKNQTENYPYKNVISHLGGLLGTSTFLILFPDQDIVGVAFANRGFVLGLDQFVLNVAQKFQNFV